MTPAAPSELGLIALALKTSTVTIIIGAGASLPFSSIAPVEPPQQCTDDIWNPESDCMPSGDQLAGYLAQRFQVQRGSLAI